MKEIEFMPMTFMFWTGIVTYSILIAIEATLLYGTIALYDPNYLVLFIIGNCLLVALIIGVPFDLVKVPVVFIMNEEKITTKNFRGKTLKECKVEDIVRVIYRQTAKGGQWIVFEDKEKRPIGIKKNSYISFAYSEKRLQLLRQVWQGKIENLSYNIYKKN